MIDLLSEYGATFGSGLLETLRLFLLISFVGLVLGVPCGFAVNRLGRAGRLASSTVTGVIVAIPAIVILYWFYYPLPLLLGLELSPFFTAVLAFSIINAASVVDIVSKSIASVPNEFDELSKVTGVSARYYRQRVQLPFIFLYSLPAYLVLCIATLHITLFAGLISVGELFRVAQRINAVQYKPVEIFSAMAIFFVVTCLPLQIIARIVQEKVNRCFGFKPARSHDTP